MAWVKPRLRAQRGWQAASMGAGRGAAGYGAPPTGGSGAVSNGSLQQLQGGYGLAIDFTDAGGAGSVSVVDAGTPANNQTNVTAASWLTVTSSAKWILTTSGLYTQTAGNSLAFEYNSGYYLLAEPAATNLALQSNDFSNASWTKSTLTGAKDATGPDGVANSASTLTATNANATALQAITSGSATRITSCFLRRKTGTGNVDITQDNGSLWTTQTLTTAWQRFSIASVTSTNPTVGIRIVTNGDAVECAWFQHEVGALVTSPIATAGSTVTRNADVISFLKATMPWGVTMSTVSEYVPAAVVSTARDYLLQLIDSGNNRWTIRIADSAGNQPTIAIGNGSTNASLTPAAAANVDAVNKLALTHDGSSCAMSLNGAAVVTGATGYAVSADTTVYFGSNTGPANTARKYRKLLIVPYRMGNTDLQYRTT